MGKVSNATKDAIETQMGIQAGNVEIVAAVCKIHQFPPNKKTGNQSAPFSCTALQLQKLDQDMDATEDEPEWVYYSLGKDSISKYHPGNIDNAEDDEPTDEGDDVDTEGNCINGINGDAPNKKCKHMALMASLEKCGVKPEVLGKGYLPDLVGIKGHVFTQKMEKIDDKDEPTVLVFDKITYNPTGGKKKGPVAAPAAKDAKKGAKPAPAAAKEESADDEINGKAQEVLATLAAKLSGTSCPISKLKTLAQTILIKEKAAGATTKAVQKLFDSDWMETVGQTELELVTDITDGVVTFA